MSQFYFNPVFGYPLVAATVIILLALLALQPGARRVSNPRRVVLLLLRGGVVLLLLIAMLRPMLVYTEVKVEPATLVVLADRSRSMQVSDAVGSQSRFTAMQDVLNQSASRFAALGDNMKVKFYTFAEDITQVDVGDKPKATGKLDLGTAPDGVQSAIGASLEEILRRESDGRMAGIVLLSDGAQRAYAPDDLPPQTPARRMADIGVPLFTFAFGQTVPPDQARDLQLDNLVTNPTVFVKNRLDASAMLTVNGYARQDLPVQLLFETADGKMSVVDTVRVSATANGEKLPVELDYIPQVSGEHKVTVRVEPQDGELVTTNNDLSTFITVLAGGVNVLYLEGAIRVESSRVRRAIDASPDVQVDFEVLQKPTGKFAIGDRFEPGKYDVVILGNVDADAFEPGDLEKLAAMVEAGTGLMMIGGYHSFGPGGYQQSPLAELLPVRMDRLERQRFSDPVREELHWPGPISLRPAEPQGTRHPIMQLAPRDENMATWAKLPPLDGANRFGRLQPTAIVLAESADDRHIPLLVAGQPGGDARVLAFAGDSTWHWPMMGFRAEHQRFWRQVVLWLAHKEETGQGAWIRLDRRRFEPHGRVQFVVGARDADGQPVDDASFDVKIIMPDGQSSEVPLSRRDKQMVGTFTETTQPGDYTITVSASDNGALLGDAKARFLVFEHDLELDNPVADPGLLTSLARITEQVGGRSLVPEQLPELLDELRQEPPHQEIERETKTTYYDRWPFFLLFVALIGAEWYLRKRWGLV